MPSPIPLRHADVGVLFHVLEEFAAGDRTGLLTYAALSKSVGYDVRSGQGYARLSTARRAMQKEKGVVFIPSAGTDRGKGLVVADDEAIVGLSARDRRRAGRLAARSRRRLALVRFDRLSPTAQVSHNTEGVLLGVVSDVCTNKAAAKINEVIGTTQGLLSSRRAIEALFA